MIGCVFILDSPNGGGLLNFWGLRNVCFNKYRVKVKANCSENLHFVLSWSLCFNLMSAGPATRGVRWFLRRRGGRHL